MNNKHEFEERKIIYKPVEDVFFINKLNRSKKLEHRLHNVSKKGLTLSAITATLSLPALYINETFLLNIEDHIFSIMFISFILGIISFFIYMWNDSEGAATNKSIMYSENLFKQAVTFSIVAALLLALPSMLTTETRGCFSGYSTHNIKDNIQLDTNQSKDLPEGYYVRTI